MTLEAQFPLGMFEGIGLHRRRRFELRTGGPADRSSATASSMRSATTGRYGEAALHRFVRRSDAMAPLQAVRSLLGDLRAFVGDGDLDDDAVAVCLDWTGTH